MKQWFFLALLIFCATGCASPSYEHPHILIKTEAGDIELELYENKAPRTVSAFLSYVKAGYYKNSSFYRILSNDNQPSNAPKANLIQGGIWKTDYKRAKSLPGIPHESTQQTGLLHKNGTISLARQEPGTGTTEFFICVGDQPGFDFGGENNADGQGYAAFGKVVKGMEVVQYIYERPAEEQAFDPPVAIISIKEL